MFPLHPFLVELLAALGILLSQLNPNSYRLVVRFLLCCQLYHIDPFLENFLGVFSPRLTPGECFFHFSPRPGLLFIHEKPSSYGTWKSRFFFVQKSDRDVPFACHPSLNELPPVNLKLVKERVKNVGLLDHGFKAKALLEEDLLNVAGSMRSQIHILAQRVVIFAFSSGRGRSPSRTPLVVRPSSASPSPVPLQHADVPIEAPIIEWTLLRRPRIEDLSQEEVPPVDTTEAPPPASLPLPVMTPQFNPKAALSNMCKVVHREDAGPSNTCGFSLFSLLPSSRRRRHPPPSSRFLLRYSSSAIIAISRPPSSIVGIFCPSSAAVFSMWFKLN
ncbi:hypothetical protein Salat_1696300 [Sesamum alatum]|uniref:Uncharacterized protein n=1 Tax=Sesamum alatum TaxID=300844 RepID=A0AAE2CK18_9LAMI|nr:hypothetical protein Salat_1696300 [Sesamum alatum]